MLDFRSPCKTFHHVLKYLPTLYSWNPFYSRSKLLAYYLWTLMISGDLFVRKRKKRISKPLVLLSQCSAEGTQISKFVKFKTAIQFSLSEVRLLVFLFLPYLTSIPVKLELHRRTFIKKALFHKRLIYFAYKMLFASILLNLIRQSVFTSTEHITKFPHANLVPVYEGYCILQGLYRVRRMTLSHFILFSVFVVLDLCRMYCNVYCPNLSAIQ